MRGLEPDLFGLRGRRLGLFGEELLRLDRRLVQEGRGSVDRAHSVGVRDVLTDLVGGLLPFRDVAGEAALEAQKLPEVLGQDGLLEVALDENRNRLIAEQVVQLLGGRE